MADAYRPGGWRINQSLERVRGLTGSAHNILTEVRQVVDKSWTDKDKRQLDEMLFDLTMKVQSLSNEITSKLWTEVVEDSE